MALRAVVPSFSYTVQPVILNLVHNLSDCHCRLVLAEHSRPFQQLLGGHYLLLRSHALNFKLHTIYSAFITRKSTDPGSFHHRYVLTHSIFRPPLPRVKPVLRFFSSTRLSYNICSEPSRGRPSPFLN